MAKEKGKDKTKLVKVCCPSCQTELWVDPVIPDVVKFEKAKKKKKSLDSLLVREKKRKSEFDRKFERSAQLRKEQWKEAQDKFKKAFNKLGDED